MYRLKLLIILLVAVGLTSCDLLENQEPQQSLPAEGGLETIGDYESALVGAYNNLQEFSNGDNSGQLLFAGDIMTGDAFWTGSFTTYVEISAQQMSAANASIEGHWNGAYEAINSANIILSGLEDLEADQAAIDNIRGQALFIRALEYYYLVQYFAHPWGFTADNSHLGVPLQLEPVTSQDDFAQPSRATVDEVYSQILSDLQTAEGLISNTTPNRATNGAVTALQARIALIQEDWGEAADLANQVIPQYELLESVTEYFRNENSAESIFAIQHTAQDVPDPANTSLTAVYNAGTRDDIQVSQDYVDALDAIITDDQEAALTAAGQTAEDTRVTQLLTGTTVQESNSAKYEDVVNEADNVPVLRLPEMILTRAEALAEQAPSIASADAQEAINLLNQIRTRAITVTNDATGGPGNQALIEYTTADFADTQELIDAILLERRVELAYEGIRKVDLQRREMEVNGTPWDANELVFPIPQSQMDANDNITQNDGYGGS